MRTAVVVGCFLTAAAVGFVLTETAAFSQGSGSSRVNPPQQPRRPQTAEEFARDFWQFVTRPDSGYSTWKVMPGQAPAAENPHGAAGQTYANPVATGNLQAPPFGSILVRENLGPDQKTSSGTSVMYRVQGTDPKNFDWYWMQFQPDGSIAQKDGKLLAGRVTSCIECHQKAKVGDLVFFNDQPSAAGK
jgi:cytochrome P460